MTLILFALCRSNADPPLECSRIFDSTPRFFCRRPQTQGPGAPFISVFSHFLAKTDLDVKKSFLPKVMEELVGSLIFSVPPNQLLDNCFDVPNIIAFE